jgi:hypothetical protein
MFLMKMVTHNNGIGQQTMDMKLITLAFQAQIEAFYRLLMNISIQPQ